MFDEVAMEEKKKILQDKRGNGEKCGGKKKDTTRESMVLGSYRRSSVGSVPCVEPGGYTYKTRGGKGGMRSDTEELEESLADNIKSRN